MTAHRILLASAGTGKTYALVHRVLGLLLSGADLDGVVATTFTRKAAGQILDRLMARLLEVVDCDRALAEVRDATSDLCDPEHVTREACGELLVRLARQIHRARLSTLDAWFVQAVSLRDLELGLLPGWSLASNDEADAMWREAVARLVREVGGADLRGLLSDVVGRRKAAARNVQRTLLDTARSGVDLLHAASDDAWTRWRPPAPPSAVELRAAARWLSELDLPLTKAGTPVKAWEGSRDALLEALQPALEDEGHPLDGSLLSSGLPHAILEGKPAFARHEITEAVVAGMTPVLAAFAAPELADVAARTAARHELLGRFDERLDAIKRERGRYVFDDLPRLLGRGDGLGDASLAYRGLGRVAHLLLDEYQDTSLPQWLVLEPLAGELFADRSGARSVFCVGDVKQSIYGWRGGEPRLLAGLGAAYDVAPETLVENYRSAPVILSAVTDVLTGVGGWSALAEDPALAEVGRRWAAEWPVHVAHHQRRKGRVSVWEAGNADDPASVRSAALCDRAADLAAEAALAAPHAQVAVLLRTNRPIPRLIHALRARGVAASGEGGNPVGDAEAVQLALSALTLADHPGDGRARLHLAASPWGRRLGLVDHDDHERARALADRIRRALISRGYGGLLSVWQRELVEGDERFGTWDRRRFGQLIELGTAWDERADLRPSRFVAFVRAEPVEDPSTSRVKVMTLHKAKGLEFDAVVLPELHKGLRPDGVLVGHADPRARPDTVVTDVRTLHTRLDPELMRLSDETRARSFDELLCLLYVAMTRAERRLDIVLPPPSRSGADMHLAGLVRERLAPGCEPDDDGLLLHVQGSTPGWEEGIVEDVDVVEPEPAPVLRLPKAAARRTLPTVSPSSLEGGGRRSGADLLDSRVGSGALSWGTAMHALFEQVGWLDGFASDDEALRAELARRRLDGPSTAELLAAFRRALASEEIVALLTRPDDGAARELWRERDFVLRETGEGGEQLLRGTFDRVVITRGVDGVATAAEVIDWKSDTIEDEARLAEACGYYAPQLQAYRRAAARLAGLDETAVRCRLAFTQPGRVVDV